MPWEEQEVLFKSLNNTSNREEYLTIRNKLVESNLRLVLSIAKSFVRYGVEFSDIIADGNDALVRAVEAFNVSLGYHFSTFASLLIRQDISRAIKTYSRVIQIPHYMYEKLRDSDTIMNYGDNNVIATTMKRTTSLNDTLTVEEDSGEVINFIEDKKSNTEEDALNNITKNTVKRFLKATLNPREEQIFTLRYGLDDGIIHTLDEVGTLLNVSRERVRQIEIKTLSKLKHFPYRGLVQDFYGIDTKPKLKCTDADIDRAIESKQKENTLHKNTKPTLKNVDEVNLLLLLNCSKEDLDYILSKYSNSYKLKYILDNIDKELTDDNLVKFNKYIFEFREILLSRLPQIGTLKELLSCTDDELFWVISLNPGRRNRNKMEKFLMSIFGENQEKEVNLSNLIREDRIKLASYLNKLRKALGKISLRERLQCNEYSKGYINEYNYSYIVGYIRSKDYLYELFTKVYGEDLKGYEDLSTLDAEEINKYNECIRILEQVVTKEDPSLVRKRG